MRREERLRREAAAWIARLNGPDGAAARQAFEQWRAAHPSHAQAYARVERSWERSRLLAHSPLTWNPTRPIPMRSRHPPKLAAIVGGSATLAAACAVIFWLSPAEPPLRYRTATGEIRSVVLADGSRVTLDTGTELSVDLSSSARRVRLERGRARFTVVHDRAQPFVVTAGNVRIADLGTVFDVDRRGVAVGVLVLSGSVKVRPIASARPGPGPAAATLTPGQQARVDAGAIRVSRAPMPIAGQGWTSGMLAFDDVPLRAVLDQANRYSRAPVRLGDAALGDLRVTGAFRVGSPDTLARSLAATFDLQAELQADGSIILAAPGAPSTERSSSKNGG